MRYDACGKRIIITADELMTIAKRGISRTVTDREDEAERAQLPLPLRRAIIGEAKKLPLIYSFEHGGYLFELHGEADRIEDGRLTVLAPSEISPMHPRRDEVESARGVAFLLGFMYSEVEGTSSVGLEIIYYNERTSEYFTAREDATREKLEKFFARCLGSLIKYARPEVERVTKRLPTMKRMKFPYSTVRDGQDELIRATYRSLSRGKTLYACAPTGTGKTVSVLYPALRLLGEGKHDKVFYLTPKSTTAKMAKECIELLAKDGAIIRAIVLTSKEGSCKEGLICRRKASLCRLSDPARLSDAAIALYDRGVTVVTLSEVREVAESFSVCPYELELCYSELCDAVICDVNYLFDPRAYLRRYFELGGSYSVLIDEAHNLAERAREMYSAELSTDVLTTKLTSKLIDPDGELGERRMDIMMAMREALFPYVRDEIQSSKEGERGAVDMSSMPIELYPVLEDLLGLLELELKRAYTKRDEAALDRIEHVRELFYEVRRFTRRADAIDESYRVFIFYEGMGDIRIKLFAVDTGPIIRSVLEKVRGAVFFSATLSPLDYYKSVLGGDRSSEEIVALSPFAPECLSVSIIDKISTRYSERERTLPAVSRTVAAVMSAKRGKYMVFAPSFEYLDAIADDFEKKYPKIKAIRQRRDMTAKEKAAFLAEFEQESDRYLVGFSVLGGIYSEGIDLVGDRLIGAIVVGIGMPQLSYEREAMSAYFDEKYEAGKQYAYIYPGMNRVLQAAGRVIRTENDRGVIVLIDDRFADPIYKKHIPALWQGMEYVGDAKELSERIKSFWRDMDGGEPPQS